MKKIRWTVPALVFFLLSCNNDDPLPEPVNEVVLPNFTALAIKNEQVFQLDVTAGGNTVEENNLTAEIGVPQDFAQLDVSGSLITFFEVIFNNFSVYQKDLDTNAVFSSGVICELDAGESRFFSLNSTEKFLLFSVDPNGCDPLQNNLNILDKETGDCVKFALDNSFNCNSNVSALVDGETAYISQLTATGEALLKKLDLNTLEVTAEISIAGDFKATINGDTLYVFTPTSLITYNKADLSFVNATNLNTSLGGQVDGWFKTDFDENIMVFDIRYPQPSAIEQGPALFNLESGEIVAGEGSFLFNLQAKLGDELQNDVLFTAYTVDLSDTTILVAYKTSGSLDDGGIVKTNFEGEILTRITLDYEVQRIILR